MTKLNGIQPEERLAQVMKVVQKRQIGEFSIVLHELVSANWADELDDALVVYSMEVAERSNGYYSSLTCNPS